MALYKSLVKKVSIPADKKTKQKEYEEVGQLAIIDQGKKLIGGYTNNLNMQLECALPVIIFGDHTCAVKYVDFPFGAGADGIKVLSPKDEVLPKYLFYGTQYLTLRFPDRGYARHYQHIEKMDLRLPELGEQLRIVTRIEELFSELDKGVETLQTIKQQLEVYQQAVLNMAFEGTMMDSPIKALESLGGFIEKPRYGTSKKCDYFCDDDSTPVYRIPNIDHFHGKIDKQDIKFAKFTEGELRDLRLQNDDILIIRSNGSVSLVGRAAIVKEFDIKGTFAGYLMRLRITDTSVISPRYLLYYLNTHTARVYIESKAKSTSGVNNINSSEICGLKIPIVEYKEQVRIIDAIELRLSVCDNINQMVNTALSQAEAMRQSILKKAFEGELSE